MQRLCYACDEFSHQFFVNDHEHPYTIPADKPFMWIRGRQVGGKTFCWARESYRYSDYEFKAASRDGYGEDWPFSYRDLEPYYDKVESLHRRERLAGRPGADARRQISAAHESFLRRGCVAQEDHRGKIRLVVMPDRVANLTVPHQRPPGLPLLRRVPARMLHRVLLQQPFGYAARRRAHRPVHPGERRRGEPRGDGQARRPGRAASTTSIA